MHPGRPPRPTRLLVQGGADQGVWSRVTSRHGPSTLERDRPALRVTRHSGSPLAAQTDPADTSAPGHSPRVAPALGSHAPWGVFGAAQYRGGGRTEQSCSSSGGSARGPESHRARSAAGAIAFQPRARVPGHATATPPVAMSVVAATHRLRDQARRHRATARLLGMALRDVLAHPCSVAQSAAVAFPIGCWLEDSYPAI